MKAQLLVVVSLIILGGKGQAQSQLNTTTRPPLTAVTVYLNGAALEHQGRVALPAGTSKLVVEGLSTKINEKTLEVQLGDGAELVAISDDEGLPPVVKNRTAADSLNRAEEGLRTAEAELKGLEEEKAFLQANRVLAAGTQANWSAEMQKGATLMRTRLAAIHLETNRLQTQQTQLQTQIKELRPRAAGTSSTGRIVLLVRAAQAANVPLALRYYVNARGPWMPKLDIRSNDSGRELQFVSKGILRNQSGLDWQRVRLTIASQALADDVSKPELQPWELDFDGGDHIGEGRIDQFVVKGTAKGRPAEITQSTRYEVPETITLAVGGRREIILPALRLPAQPEYLSVPKVSEDVVLQAKVAGWEGLHLPEEADVYHRGGYVGTTELNSRAYNDSLEVALGHDDQLVVGRTKLEDFSGKAGLSGKRRVRLTYELNVRNRHPEAVRLRIVDQVPVSSEKEIEVKVLETSGAQLDERTGKLTWILPLAPGASQRLRFSFQVEYPQEKQVEIIQHRQSIKSPKFR